MINRSALLMGVVMVVTAAGTYYGLEALPPGLIPPPIGRAHAAEAPPVEPAVVAAAPVAPVETADAAAAEVTEQDLAEEPAPEAVATAEPAASPAPAPIQARAPERELPAEETPTAPAATESQPTETAKAESATAPAPAPARAAADADVIKPWWPDPAKLPANQLKLQYAGQVQGQPAIALLFSSAPKLETLQQNATVKSANGETVSGEWSLGKNPKLAVLSGLAPGRYTVILQPQVADQQGFMLGATLTGPVYVKAQ